MSPPRGKSAAIWMPGRAGCRVGWVWGVLLPRPFLSGPGPRWNSRTTHYRAMARASECNGPAGTLSARQRSPNERSSRRGSLINIGMWTLFKLRLSDILPKIHLQGIYARLGVLTLGGCSDWVLGRGRRSGGVNGYGRVGFGGNAQRPVNFDCGGR